MLGSRSTSSTGASAERDTGAERLRPLSYASRKGVIARPKSAQTAPTASAAHCQPRASTRSGTVAPAMAVPSGTPVCLIEKVSESMPGGAVRARITGSPAWPDRSRGRRGGLRPAPRAGCRSQQWPVRNRTGAFQPATPGSDRNARPSLRRWRCRSSSRDRPWSRSRRPAGETPSNGAATGAMTGAQYIVVDTSVWIASVSARGRATLRPCALRGELRASTRAWTRAAPARDTRPGSRSSGHRPDGGRPARSASLKAATMRSARASSSGLGR